MYLGVVHCVLFAVCCMMVVIVAFCVARCRSLFVVCCALVLFVFACSCLVFADVGWCVLLCLVCR